MGWVERMGDREGQVRGQEGTGGELEDRCGDRCTPPGI